uniref:Recep_L_domain domain-containing protein n=1 Tax=Strongyloides venezuelensis TaxID=75913 RepID=A0A0K0G4T0_STRVS
MVTIKPQNNLALLFHDELIKSTTSSTLEKINITDTNDVMHFCKRQLKISRVACCDIVRLLNDTNKLPFCDFIISGQRALTINNTYNKPVYLEYPNDVHEDHVTFIFGIAFLISIAGLCTFILSKLTRPNMFGRVPISYMTNSSQTNDCRYLMWLPYCNYRGSSMLLYLRGVTCGNGRPSGVTGSNSTSLSIVSQSSLNILPSYQSATSCPSTTPLTMSTIISPISLPPPAYDENDDDQTTTNNNFDIKSVNDYNSNVISLVGRRG